MSDKFQNKYRIPSARLQGYDYGQNGAYFITICTQNRVHFFGEIVDNEMRLNELREIVEKEWIRTLELRPDMNLEMGEFVVMPNHFHAIIIIGENQYNTQRTDNGNGDGCCCRDAMHRISTTTTITEYKNKFAPQSKNLASIVRGFKSSVTTNARKIHADFGWQSRFHDHIIRDSESFGRIQTYIENNPKKWKDDRFYG